MTDIVTRDMIKAEAQQSPMVYYPANWYYFIGADTSNVYSSARLMMVPVTDPVYLEWLGQVSPRTPTPMANMRALEVHMGEHYPPGTLKSYNAASRWTKMSGLVPVTVTGMPFFTDPISRAVLINARDYAVASPGYITNMKMLDGTFVAMTEAQLTNAVQRIAEFVQACFNCEATNVAAIDAGSFTTLAQIEASFDAISTVLP